MLLYCPCSSGGIFAYAKAQAQALASHDLRILVVTAGTNLGFGELGIPLSSIQDESIQFRGPRIFRWIRRAVLITHNIWKLKKYVKSTNAKRVLLASYIEYASPLWVPIFVSMKAQGISFGAILHDPVRDYVVGPMWFHRLSIKRAFSYLDLVFVHEKDEEVLANLPVEVPICEIPHGPFRLPYSSSGDRIELRSQLGIPKGAKLFLSFGQIRDGKNLDLVISSMSSFEDVWLVVCGQPAGGQQKPLSHYKTLALEMGVHNRCLWIEGYLPDEEVGNYFAAADFVLLTYSKRFRSASGVLNLAVQFRKPCLASSGSGPLQTQVNRYKLGVWINPDSLAEVLRGIELCLQGAQLALWDEYEADNSWDKNAALVIEHMSLLASTSAST